MYHYTLEQAGLEMELLENMKNETENEKDEIATFCFDTCVVSMLMGYVFGERKYIKEMQHENRYDYIKKLLDYVKSGKVKGYIPYKAFRELLKGNEYRDFNIIEFCKYYGFEVVDFYKKDDDKAKIKCLALANMYCRPLSKEEVVKCQKTFGDRGPNYNLTKPIFRRNEMNYPENDAYIMAASTMLGLPIITENAKDFTRYYKPEIIAFKNSQWGLSTSAIPMDVKQAISYIENNKKFPKFNSRYNSCILSKTPEKLGVNENPKKPYIENEKTL